ncbi:MAG: hypothetical protein IPI23_21170 [Bacteroidetes bacterium]|nr:hypothetical protein [Bacteroidota bacterium]
MENTTISFDIWQEIPLTSIMKIDSSIVNVGDSLDVYFEALQSIDTSNSGVLYNIQSLLETIPDSALLLIEAMVPENELEEKLLAFYHIYLDALYADDNLSATDSAEVLEWTQGNLALSGEVYFNSWQKYVLKKSILNL